MKLIIGEAYSIKDYCFPIVEIELNNIKELPNIKYLNDREMEITEEVEYPYILNFTYGFFDSLSATTIEKLTEVYSLFGNDYIGSKMWIYYTVASGIELSPTKTINRAFKIVNSNTDTKEKINTLKKTFPYLNRSTNKIAKTIFFPYDVDVYLFSNMLKGYDTGFALINEVIVKTELELLYSFMNFIFTSKYNYYIKKCEKCNGYYISNKSDTKYCSRVISNGKTCKQLVAKNQVKNAYTKERSRIDKRFREYFGRQPLKTYNQFLTDYGSFRNTNPNYTDDELLTFLETYKKDYLLSLTKL